MNVRTQHNPTNTTNGTLAQIKAATRQGTTLPSKKTIKNPRAADIPAQATKAPRIDGWLYNNRNMNNNESVKNYEFDEHTIFRLYMLL